MVGLMDVLINRSGSLRLWGRSCWRWHLGPGVEWDVPLDPGHLRLASERAGPLLLQQLAVQWMALWTTSKDGLKRRRRGW